MLINVHETDEQILESPECDKARTLIPWFQLQKENNWLSDWQQSIQRSTLLGCECLWTLCDPVGLLCPLPQPIRTARHLLTALMFSASLSQVDTANSWSNYSKWAPSSQHPQTHSDCSWMDDRMPLRLLRLFSYPKAPLCRHCEQYSGCCTVFVLFFNIWKCCISLCLVLLLVNKPDSF